MAQCLHEKRRVLLQRLREPAQFCSLCGYPVCGPACQEIPEHRDFECRVFQEHGHKAEASKFDFKREESAYNVVSPLRAFLLREAKDSKEKNSRWSLLWRHMSHQKERSKSQFWRERTEQVLETAKVKVVTRVMITLRLHSTLPWMGS